MSANAAIAYNLEFGPTRDRLMDSFKFAHEGKNVAREFRAAIHHDENTFTTAQLANMQITSIEHEDHTGYNFNFSGTCRACLENPNNAEAELKDYKFTAKYNARRRKGRIKFVEA